MAFYFSKNLFDLTKRNPDVLIYDKSQYDLPLVLYLNVFDKYVYDEFWNICLSFTGYKCLSVHQILQLTDNSLKLQTTHQIAKQTK